MRRFLILATAFCLVSTPSFANSLLNFNSAECVPLTAAISAVTATFLTTPDNINPDCLITNEDSSNYAFVRITSDASLLAGLPAAASGSVAGPNVYPVGPGQSILFTCNGRKYISAITRTGTAQLELNRGQGN